MEGVPVVLHEQNAVPGIANRLAARVASRIAVGVDAAAAAFPPERTTVVGNPVRPELARLDRAALHDEAVAAFGLDPGRRTLFVFGGSQGARRINQAVVAATAHWPDPAAVQVLHACGRRDEADVRAAWAEADPDGRGLLVKIVPFVDRMDLAYAAADLAMTRAGAITVAELTAAGMPAVMVPLPHATADHQAANARAVAAGGGAVVADDATLDGPAVVAAVAPLLADPGRLAAMAEAMRAQAHPAAAEELAALVVEASGRATREQFLAEVAAAAAPVDREATGWFESAGTPAGGPAVQRRVDRRTKRMEAYPPIDRKAHPAAQTGRAGAPPRPPRTPQPATGCTPPDDPQPDTPPPGRAGDASSNGRRRPSSHQTPRRPPGPADPPADHAGGPPDPTSRPGVPRSTRTPGHERPGAGRDRPPADTRRAGPAACGQRLEHATGRSATLPLRGPRSGAPGLERGPRAVHLVGVGGAGMSGLARLLLAGGHRVTGSDRSESATLEALRALGAGSGRATTGPGWAGPTWWSPRPRSGPPTPSWSRPGSWTSPCSAGPSCWPC